MADDKPDNRVRWDAEMLAEVQDRWKAGQSAGEIAWAFSRKYAAEISRSAVLGKLNRLGLLHRVRSITVRRPPPARPAAVKPPPAVEVHIAASVHLDRVPAAAPIPLVDLESWHCRWPMWDHEERPTLHLFCGAVALEAKPYCAKHMRQGTTGT